MSFANLSKYRFHFTFILWNGNNKINIQNIMREPNANDPFWIRRLRHNWKVYKTFCYASWPHQCHLSYPQLDLLIFDPSSHKQLVLVCWSSCFVMLARSALLPKNHGEWNFPPRRPDPMQIIISKLRLVIDWCKGDITDKLFLNWDRQMCWHCCLWWCFM